MDDLLKDAIADAKAVRETALENAKIALEEAFTPRLQSMLSKKIQSEIISVNSKFSQQLSFILRRISQLRGYFDRMSIGPASSTKTNPNWRS